MILAALGLLLLGSWTAAADGKRADTGLRQRALDLNDLTGSDPMRGRLKELVDDPAATRKLLAVAADMAKEKPQPLNRNATYLLALAAENLKDVDASAAFYRLNALQSLRLYSERGLAQAYVGLIQLYAENKRYADSEKVCKEFLALEGEEDDTLERLKPLVMRRMILAIAKQGSLDRALKMVDDLIKSDARNWLHRALKAQVLREAEKYDEAAKLYLDVIDRVKRDTRLDKDQQNDYTDEYRYLLSGIYIDMNQVDKAAEQLKVLLEREPNNATYNNDLGFIWADHGTNLEEAEKLIRKAMDEDRKQRRKINPSPRPEDDRDNAAYLDSLGWVLFKRGKAKEAREQLQLAVKDRDGQALEIYDHLADVLMALGAKDEAIAAWKKGLETVRDTKRDQKRKAEVEKKLKQAESK
ncbi:MAG: tetratricopeptide repeat protein [Gemmataceae bacterium]